MADRADYWDCLPCPSCNWTARHTRIERWLARRLALLMQGYMEGRLTLADFNRRLSIAWRACDRVHGCLAKNTTGVEP